MGPAPMEGIERTNAIVVRGSGAGVGQNMGFLLDETPLLWREIMGGIVTYVGDLGIWLAIAGTRDRGVE